VYGAATSEDYKIKVDRGSIGGACKYAKLCTAPYTSGHYKMTVHRGSVQTREAVYGAVYFGTKLAACIGPHRTRSAVYWDASRVPMHPLGQAIKLSASVTAGSAPA
jgi:hypothetical protein